MESDFTSIVENWQLEKQEWLESIDAFLQEYGEEKANELKKKVANIGEKNGFFGKQHSKEQRKKKSAEKLAAPKLKCYHCLKEVDHMNYSRWHGDKCKHKGE